VTDPMYPVAPGARPRPATVSTSSYLLFGVAALMLLEAVLSLSVIGRTLDVAREVYAGTTAEGTEGVIVGVSVIGTIVNVIVAAGLVILALLNNRGRNAARITTWVVGGISLCCGGVGLAGSALTNSFTMQSPNAGTPDPAEFERRLNAALPSWFGPVTTLLGVLILLASLAALILLALPASNDYFRKPQPG
jgi:hypothetical protein